MPTMNTVGVWSSGSRRPSSWKPLSSYDGARPRVGDPEAELTPAVLARPAGDALDQPRGVALPAVLG